MRILISHSLPEPLNLPLSYHQIIQGIIYHNVKKYGYSDFLHNEGWRMGERSYKMFTFSLLQGRYKINGNRIIFYDEVSFQVSSPDIYLLRMLAGELSDKGIMYGDRHYDNVEVCVADATVENEEIYIRMLSPICLYETDVVTRKTHFYSPDEEEFAVAANDNFKRKYKAYYGIPPEGDICISPYEITEKDKYVTKYKGFYIGAWNGVYKLSGERKYLDFLLQTGLGSKNSQGFGMFEEVEI